MGHSFQNPEKNAWAIPSKIQRKMHGPFLPNSKNRFQYAVQYP